MIGEAPAADALAELLGFADRGEIPATIETVATTCAAIGLDVRDIVQELLRLLFPEAESILSSLTVTDDEIAACYRELRAAAASGDEERYQRVMTRLRELQAAEAQHIRRSFEADKALDRGDVDEAVRRADELLAQYEDPSR